VLKREFHREAPDEKNPVMPPVVQNFWRLASTWDEPRLRKLLFFITGSDRAPVRGLTSLKLVIQSGGPNQSSLPSSHT